MKNTDLHIIHIKILLLLEYITKDISFRKSV